MTHNVVRLCGAGIEILNEFEIRQVLYLSPVIPVIRSLGMQYCFWLIEADWISYENMRDWILEGFIFGALSAKARLM